MKLPTDNRRSKVVAAIALALMLLPTIAHAQVASSNPLEYVALAEGNELINGQIKNQIEDQQKTSRRPHSCRTPSQPSSPRFTNGKRSTTAI